MSAGQYIFRLLGSAQSFKADEVRKALTVARFHKLSQVGGGEFVFRVRLNRNNHARFREGNRLHRAALAHSGHNMQIGAAWRGILCVYNEGRTQQCERSKTKAETHNPLPGVTESGGKANASVLGCSTQRWL